MHSLSHNSVQRLTLRTSETGHPGKENRDSLRGLFATPPKLLRTQIIRGGRKGGNRLSVLALAARIAQQLRVACCRRSPSARLQKGSRAAKGRACFQLAGGPKPLIICRPPAPRYRVTVASANIGRSSQSPPTFRRARPLGRLCGRKLVSGAHFVQPPVSLLVAQLDEGRN